MKSPRFYRRFDYAKSLLPNARLRQLEEGVEDYQEARRRTGQSIGYPGWGVLYHVALSHLEPHGHNTIVETGTNHGCSTIVLAQALIDARVEGRVVTFEIDPANVAAATANFEAAGVAERIDLVEGDTLEVLAPRLKGIDRIRIAFLDGCHTADHVLFEFESILPKLDPTSLVMFDNTFPLTGADENPRVYAALRTILERHGGHLVNLEFVSWYTPGLAIWQRDPLHVDGEA